MRMFLGLLAAVPTLTPGCARTDWIERTPATVNWWRWEELNLRHGAYEACSGSQFRHAIMTTIRIHSYIAGGLLMTTTSICGLPPEAAGTQVGTRGAGEADGDDRDLAEPFPATATTRPRPSGAPRLPARLRQRRFRDAPHHSLGLVGPLADRIRNGPGRNLVGFRFRLGVGGPALGHVLHLRRRIAEPHLGPSLQHVA